MGSCQSHQSIMISKSNNNNKKKNRIYPNEDFHRMTLTVSNKYSSNGFNANKSGKSLNSRTEISLDITHKFSCVSCQMNFDDMLEYHHHIKVRNSINNLFLYFINDFLLQHSNVHQIETSYNKKYSNNSDNNSNNSESDHKSISYSHSYDHKPITCALLSHILSHQSHLNNEIENYQLKLKEIEKENNYKKNYILNNNINTNNSQFRLNDITIISID